MGRFQPSSWRHDHDDIVLALKTEENEEDPEEKDEAEGVGEAVCHLLSLQKIHPSDL